MNELSDFEFEVNVPPVDRAYIVCSEEVLIVRVCGCLN